MSTYDDTPLGARFRALAPEPLPLNWDEVLEKAQGDHRPFRRPLRSRRRLVVVIAVALIAIVGATSALGTVGDLLGLTGKGPPGLVGNGPNAQYFRRVEVCKGMRGSLELWLGRGALRNRWKLASGTGQYARVTGGGRWRPDIVAHEGSELWMARLSGTITSGGAKQRVLITLEGQGVGSNGYVRPGRINPGTFVLRPLERGPVKPDSGSHRSVVSG